ncbi:glycoside hydrolase family 98 domain-containing protein [Porcipelethomonas sp.]|uniref:glycoside hydrolase family 98 domain-containing protein n=1 Tax=Porcipelethomonas sp. TaxID=2981675 RepID=UPI003EF59B8C
MRFKLKKFCAAFMSGVLASSMLLCSLFSSGIKDSGYIGQTLKNLSFDVEPFTASASESFRRPVSSESPMWIVHIDSWNYADPAKIIDLIPEDVLPYVVFNISLSINWDRDNHKWLMVQDGYECAKSWLRTCADKGVWAMIQPSSGGQCHFPDYGADDDLENTVFGEFFRDYPNFIGYNYCEQFWGYEQEDFPITCADRYRHFAALLKLCSKYGGYLDVSWCGNQWSPKINPLAMLKQVPEWEEACGRYSDNFILEEKYTQGSYIEDMESLVYGYYISGYCGNFGVRYDETGWTDRSSDGTETLSSKDQYRVVTGLPIFLERMVKNGATVIDGPELVWADDFRETSGKTDSDGYHVREWEMYDQYQNVMIDTFRKVQDGTIRIPDREEVISNTKLVVIQDVEDGAGKTWDEPYSTYPTLFEGLYRLSNDGNLKDNTILYKSTGTYQTIPTVYALKDNLAKSIPVQVKQSEIPSRWSTIEDKQDEFIQLYPSDYWGNCYAGRNENSWVTYNPDKNGATVGGYLSLKYNTCNKMEVTLSERASALINEYSDHIDIYTNNYDEDAKTTLKTNTFKIYGCTSEPEFTYKDRGVNQAASQISGSFSSDGTYTLTVKHNGPVDITVNCSGSETNRLTTYQKATLVEPEFPDFYTGTRQYEGELFDYKNIDGNVTNGCNSGITSYYGQGFIKFGTKSDAAVKDTVSTEKAGTFKLTLRYAVTADINNVDLYVNGSKVKTLSLPRCSSLSNWKTISENITLKAGDNAIEIKAASVLADNLYIDCFTIDGDFGDSAQKELEPLNGKLIKNLVRLDKENGENWSIYENFEAGSKLYGDRDFTAVSVPENLIGAEAIRTACDSKLLTTDLATFTAGADITVYAAVDTRVVSDLSWLNSWKNAGVTIETSNDLTLVLYKKNVSADDTVTLGTNSGSGNAVNYIVFAVPQEEVIKGDVDLNGKINVFDLICAKRGFINGYNNALAFDAADVNENGKADANDLEQIQNYLVVKIRDFTTEE